MTDYNRLVAIDAFLSFAPLPRDELDWWHEPSARLLTDDESDSLPALFERLGTLVQGGMTMIQALSRLELKDILLLETFIVKSVQGKERMQEQRFPTVLQMNMALRQAA